MTSNNKEGGIYYIEKACSKTREMFEIFLLYNKQHFLYNNGIFVNVENFVKKLGSFNISSNKQNNI